MRLFGIHVELKITPINRLILESFSIYPTHKNDFTYLLHFSGGQVKRVESPKGHVQ